MLSEANKADELVKLGKQVENIHFIQSVQPRCIRATRIPRKSEPSKDVHELIAEILNTVRAGNYTLISSHELIGDTLGHNVLPLICLESFSNMHLHFFIITSQASHVGQVQHFQQVFT